MEDGARRRALRRRLARRTAAFAALAHNPHLRRLTVALVGSVTAEGLYAVAIAVFAYDVAGAGGVGILAVARPLLAAATSPLAATLGDRFRRDRILVVTDLVRAVTLVVMGAAAAGHADGAVFVLAGVLAVATTAFWPAQAALLPSLTLEPAQLAAANVVTSTNESFGAFVGPLLCAVLLLVTGTPVLFLVAGAGFAWSAFTLAGLHAPERGHGRAREAPILDGFRAVVSDPVTRVVVLLFGAQMILAGALNVLIVIAALGPLHAGTSGVGYLTAALGIGNLVGVVGAAALVGARRLAAAFGAGLLLWSVPPALVAVWPSRVLAVVLLAVAGVGLTVVDVAGFTVLQRGVADRVLARVFGSLESVALVATALGAGLATAANALVGARGALAAAGLAVAAVTLTLWPRLRTIDAAALVPTDRVEVLQRNAIFAPLPPAALDGLAARLLAEDHAPQTVIFRQGDAGDRFYIVADGTVEIEIDGSSVIEAGPGDYFGEIALLRTAPRTATARALDRVRLYSLDGASFATAASGHPSSAEAAEAVVGARLRFRRPSGGLA